MALPASRHRGAGPMRARFVRRGQRARARLALLSGTALVSAAVCVALTPTPVEAAPCVATDTSSLTGCINNATSGATIILGNTITLTADLPAVQKSITIEGNGFTLNGNNQFRGLFIGAFSGSTQVPVTVAIQDLTIQNAKAQGGTGAAGAGGGAGLGGAIFVAQSANVTVSNVSLSSNAAAGGSSGTGPVRGGGGGMGGNGGIQAGNSGGGGGGLGIGADGAPGLGTGSVGIATGASSGGSGGGSGGGSR